MYQRSKRVAPLFSLTLVGALALAVAASARPHGDGPPLDDDARFQARMERMERAVHERLAPALEADDATADRLVALFKKAARERRQAMVAVRGERQALRALVESGASDAELEAQLKRLNEAMARMPVKGSILEDTRDILTVQQQAKLTLMAPKVLGHHKGKGHPGKHGRKKWKPTPDESGAR